MPHHPLPTRRCRHTDEGADFKAALACLGAAGSAFAEKLDKEAKKWLDEVKPIMLTEEEKTFRELKDEVCNDRRNVHHAQ